MVGKVTVAIVDENQVQYGRLSSPPLIIFVLQLEKPRRQRSAISMFDKLSWTFHYRKQLVITVACASLLSSSSTTGGRGRDLRCRSVTHGGVSEEGTFLPERV